MVMVSYYFYLDSVRGLGIRHHRFKYSFTIIFAYFIFLWKPHTSSKPTAQKINVFISNIIVIIRIS